MRSGVAETGSSRTFWSPSYELVPASSDELVPKPSTECDAADASAMVAGVSDPSGPTTCESSPPDDGAFKVSTYDPEGGATPPPVPSSMPDDDMIVKASEGCFGPNSSGIRYTAVTVSRLHAWLADRFSIAGWSSSSPTLRAHPPPQLADRKRQLMRERWRYEKFLALPGRPSHGRSQYYVRSMLINPLPVPVPVS